MARTDEGKARDAERRLRGHYREFRILEVLARARTKITGETLMERVDPDTRDLMVIVDAENMVRRGLLVRHFGRLRGRAVTLWAITAAGRRRLKKLEGGR